MKKAKIFAAVVIVILMSITVFNFITYAAGQQTQYYDRFGNKITIDDMYYDNQGCPMFNENCYYIDTDGNTNYVGDEKVYYRNSRGRLIAAEYYYDTDGNVVPCPVALCPYGVCDGYCYSTNGYCTRYYSNSNSDYYSGATDNNIAVCPMVSSEEWVCPNPNNINSTNSMSGNGNGMGAGGCGGRGRR